MPINSSWYTSLHDHWATPQVLFDNLNREFHFTIDVCADPSNAKCPVYYTKEQDGLAQDWGGQVCWCNPPYGDAEYPCKPGCKKKRCIARGHHIDKYVPGIKDWVAKASQYTTVCLLPARTDTAYFHDYIYGYADVRFLRGRLKFCDEKGRAPFPSMVVVFNKLRDTL